MDYYSKQISKLIEELSSLPGIGSKSAQRLAFHILNMPTERVERLADTILDARKNIRYCKTCYTLTDLMLRSSSAPSFTPLQMRKNARSVETTDVIIPRSW